NRRQFLRTTTTAAVLGSAGLLRFPVPGLARDRSPSSKLNIVCVGINGMGAGNLNQVKSENIIALCDVNANNLEVKGAIFRSA
ncbi:MAG: twin-arginine translocation signal domain-containing protein, partial [Fibrobacter sp.]|nr:twin-arginine translocation signal domain-containing protein [Fibrobacter sp.]